MADSTNTIYQKIMYGNWEEWTGNVYCKVKRRHVKRKFNRVSREEVEEGLDDCVEGPYGSMDEGDGREMFFADRFDFYEDYQ